MPWEIRIVSDVAGSPLGDKKAIIEWVSATLPGADLQQPPAPPEEFYDIFSPEIWEMMKKQRNLEALYEEDDLTIEFYCPDQPVIESLHADVRGNGNPLPVLARLCLPKKWAVVSSADLSHVDLSATSATQWDGFREWRDNAIDQIHEEDE